MTATSTVAGVHPLSFARAACSACSTGSAAYRAPLRHAEQATATATAVHRGNDFIDVLLGLVMPGGTNARPSRQSHTRSRPSQHPSAKPDAHPFAPARATHCRAYF